MTRRRSMTGKARLALLNAHGSQCHICGGEIQAGQSWEVEHLIPIAMGGDDEPANMRPAHSKCHRDKTDADVAAIAKAKRREIKHTGAKAPPKVKLRSKPFPKAPAREPKHMPERRAIYRSAE